MDTKTLHFIFKGIELVLALIATGIYCDQYVLLSLDTNITVGKLLFMYIGLCGYVFVTVILLIVFILDKIPDSYLNIVLSAVMALVVLTGAASCIDIYKADLYKYVGNGDYGEWYHPVLRRFQEKMMAAGSSGILAAVAFVVDIILTVFVNKLM